MSVNPIRFAGVSLLSRDSGGSLVLASYHPASSATWHWSAVVSRRPQGSKAFARAQRRTGQWHDYYWLPFGRQLIVSRQDYHRGAA